MSTNSYSIGRERSTKRDAFNKVKNLIRSDRLINFYTPSLTLKCAVMLPSIDCIDMDVFSDFFTADTKIICIENFSYIKKEINSETIFKKNFEQKTGINPKNIYYWFDDIDKLPLKTVLEDELGVSQVDFIFLDMCDMPKHNIFKWMWINRNCFAENSYQLYTIPVQRRGTISQTFQPILDEMPLVVDYNDNIEVAVIDGEKRNYAKTNKSLMAFVKYWNFIVSHALNTKCNGEYISPVIYNGGNTESWKMAIFTSRKLDNSSIDQKQREVRWIYNMSKLPEEFYKRTEDVQYDGIAYNSIDAKTQHTRHIQHKWNNGDIILHRDWPIYNYCRYNELLEDLLERDRKTSGKSDPNNRRWDKDRLIQKMMAITKDPSNPSLRSFPEEDYIGIHKGSALMFRRCDQVFRQLVLNNEIRYYSSTYKFIEDYKGRYVLMERNADGTFTKVNTGK